MFNRELIAGYGLVSGIFILILFFLTKPPDTLSYEGWLTAGIAILMTIWWVTEAIPIYVTGIIPIILFPLFNLSLIHI